MNGKSQERYDDLTEEQMKIVYKYYANEMKELKIICHSVWGGKGLPKSDYDDLYSNAGKTLVESARSFDENKEAEFKTYLTNNITNSFKQWYRDNYLRAKRSNLQMENGKIKLVEDENGKKQPVIIKGISFDAPTIGEDETPLAEKLGSSTTIESEIALFNGDENVEEFMNSLSKLQKDILLMRMNDYSVEETIEKLNISSKEYSKEMKSIRKNKKISLFAKNVNDGDYKMEVKEMKDRVIEVSESENYRMDKYNLFTLLQDKKNGDINCTYILQREPFQWTKEEANRYFCRVLSGLPIPEIVLCEQKIGDIVVSHLIDGLQRLSYAEAFKENRIKIGVKGSERHLIQYKEFLVDDNGNRILSENGLPTYELKVFDVIGKYYKDLPEDLKKKFNNFNINVTKFFNCTDQQIADHIRDYNNHASMNKEQSGLTKISANTAQWIKRVSKENTFFRNCGKFSDNNQIKGKIDRVIAEAIMLIFFRDDWKQDLDSIYKYIDEFANEKEFLKINSHFNRLELALGDNNSELKDLFTYSSMPMWIAVFDEFTKYNLEDSCFIEFLKAYKNNLQDEEVDGISMKNFKDKQTKKKATVTGKIDLLVKLMKESLHIEEVEEVLKDLNEDTNENQEEIISDDEVVASDADIENVSNEATETIEEFIKRNVPGSMPEMDMELYEDTLKDWTVDISHKHKLLEPENEKSLYAMMAYSYANDVDLGEWIFDYFNRNSDYIENQDENFLHMVSDLSKYIEQKEKENKEKKAGAA